MTKGSKRPASPNLAARLIGLPEHLQTVEKRAEALAKENEEIREKLAAAEQTAEKLRANLETVRAFLIKMDERLSGLQHNVALQAGEKGLSAPVVALSKNGAPSREFDYFYKMLAERFGGTEEQKLERLSSYLPLFQELPDKLKKAPIVDLAPGKGELLKILKENNFQAAGIVDSRAAMEAIRHKGMLAVESDIRTFLLKQRAGSMAAIVGLQMIERIPFETLLRIFNECYRALAPSGFVIFETPNPETLFVGASLFYSDPSRLHPLPPSLLEFMLQKAGFETEVTYNSRLQPEIDHPDPAINNLFNIIYGPENYAIIGRKGI